MLSAEYIHITLGKTTFFTLLSGTVILESCSIYTSRLPTANFPKASGYQSAGGDH